MTCKEICDLLNQKPRANLGFYPTPFYKLERLSGQLGVNLYIKREDFSGQSLFGGNKVRKLEYLLGDAKAKGAEYVFTYGATQSNHAMQTAETCRKEGMKPVLYLNQVMDMDEEPRANLLLDRILGAELHIEKPGPGETEQQVKQRLLRLAAEQMGELRKAGHPCYEIPRGGASLVGTAGFIGGFVELAEQMEAMGISGGYLFHGSGTGGTMAGLTAGKRLLGSDMTIVSVESGPTDPGYLEECARLANEAIAWLGVEKGTVEPIVPEDFVDELSYYGPGYEQPSAGGTEAVRLMAAEEGLFLDPVYSGKAFAGLLDYVRRGRIAPGSNVIFLHTGGATALFAEKEILGELF